MTRGTRRSPDNAIKDQLVFGAGSQGVEEAKFGGTHTGILRSPAGEIPPTGKPVISRYAAVSRVEDGKIVSFHMYFDLADVLGHSASCPDGDGESGQPRVAARLRSLLR